MSTHKSLAEVFKAARFAIVGGVATLVHLFVAQAFFVTESASLAVANAIGFGCAFVAGFLGHQYFTFAQTAPFWQAFRRYGVIAVAGFAVNNVVLLGLVQAGLNSQSASLALAILIVPIGTFLASRFWGFKEASKDPV